ncbi:MAG TPA: hypothetical protein VM347_30480, partial [Nonomuraea sp.]|nr:hypothetical protein [Nonomuraea sp.]
GVPGVGRPVALRLDARDPRRPARARGESFSVEVILGVTSVVLAPVQLYTTTSAPTKARGIRRIAVMRDSSGRSWAHRMIS